MPFHLVSHPLALHKLTYLRMGSDAGGCPPWLFVRLMKEMGMIMASEVMRELYEASGWKEIRGINDITYRSEVIEEDRPVMIPILRSGLVMAEGMQEVISTSPIGHIGIYHDETEEQPIIYLSALPGLKEDRYYILVDPLVATGGTALMAIDTLDKYGVSLDRIVLAALIVGSEGQKKLETTYPDVHVFAIKIGEEMDATGRSVLRGLGSVSTRQFRNI